MPDGIIPKPKRKIEDELRDMALELGRVHFDVAVGMSHFADADEDIEKLPPRQANAARFARLDRKQAPIGLELSQKFTTALLGRMLDRTDPALNRANVTVEQMVVSLPQKALPTPEADVVVVQAEEAQDDE